MKKIFFAVIMSLGFIACGKIAWAQNDEKPTPKTPYLAEVPDYGHWTVTFKYDAAAPKGAAGDGKAPAVPAGFPTIIDTIKTGELRGIFLTFADGTTKQYTCQGDWVLASGTKGAQLSIATKNERPYAFYTTGFVLLDGVKINPSTFKETEMHDGAFAFHYKSGETEVWIDPATMYPVTVKKSGVEAAYQFLPAPPKPFDIPKDQADLLKKEQDANKAVRSMR